MPESYIAAPLITAAPAFNANVIEKRAADQTCGYVSGDPNSPLVCPGTASCTFTNYYWGCCNALTCDTPAACELDSTPYCGGVAFANCVYPQIRRCSTACVTYVRSTKIGDTNLMTSWTCGATPAEYFVLATTTGGDSTSALSTSATETATGLRSPSSVTESSSTSTSASTSTSTSKPTSTSAGDTSTSISTSTSLSSLMSSITGTAATSNETASPSPTSTHVLTPGEIAGIAIGSIAGALIICAAFYFIFKKYTFVRRSPDDTRSTGGYASGGMPKPISSSGFEMSDRMAGGNGTEFHDDRTWDGPAVDVRSQTSTAWS